MNSATPYLHFDRVLGKLETQKRFLQNLLVRISINYRVGRDKLFGFGHFISFAESRDVALEP